MAATAIIAGIGLALSIGMAVKGASDQAKARRIQSNNQRPTYNIAPEEKRNQELAEYNSGFGLSEGAKQYYMNNAERGLSSGIDAILKGGGDMNNIGSLYGTFNDSNTRLAMIDDQRRMDNLRQLMNQNRSMRDEKDKSFQFNEYAPYADTAKAASELYSTGSQWISQGVNTGFKAVSTYAEGSNQRRDIRRVNEGIDGAEDLGTDFSGTGSGVGLQNSRSAQSYIGGGGNSLSSYNHLSSLTPDQQRLVAGIYSRY